MTQAPTPGPLTSESVKLLVKGDLVGAGELIGILKGVADGWGCATIIAPNGAEFSRILHKGFTFIGRPDAEGWMPWSGGENPVPGQRVERKERSGDLVWCACLSDDLRWSHSGWDTDIIAFRLAPTAPVEASGSELHPATADLVDRFAAELKSKLAKAESKYGYRDEWLKPDWQDELTKSLAEHIQKGDPRDVAAYCAFAWHHEWSVTPNINWKAEWEAVCSARIADRDRSQEIINERDAWIAELLQQAKVTTPARAEAQDEGAAGEPVAWGLQFPGKRIRHTFDAESIAQGWADHAGEGAKVVPLYAHPSPTPAADDDRVRIAVEALEYYAGPHAMPNDGPWGASSDDYGRRASEAIAALKLGRGK